ncbi:MAG: tRNA lysidine(34) synthetase TilS, partial [Chitinophagaceae bacterium]
MIDKYKRFISDNDLFSVHDLLVLAVSGGVDSAVLVDLCSRAGFQFVIAHVNFNLREQESIRDEEFVRQLAEKNNVQLFVQRVNTTAYAAAHNVAIQEAARILRYEWFEELRNSLSADLTSAAIGHRVFVVTAHHLDDSVETMLMNLFRGTGIMGLRGILPLNGKIVRPMLCFTKNDIVNYAVQQQLNWVEDSSNQLDKYTRNYFRNQLIPMIRKIYPQVDENLYHNLDRFNEAAMLYRETITRRIKKLVVKKDAELHLPVLKLQKMSGAMTVLFEILQPLGFSSAQTASVMDLMTSETGRQVQGQSHRVIKNRNWLIIAPNQAVGVAHV